MTRAETGKVELSSFDLCNEFWRLCPNFYASRNTKNYQTNTFALISVIINNFIQNCKISRKYQSTYFRFHNKIQKLTQALPKKNNFVFTPKIFMYIFICKRIQIMLQKESIIIVSFLVSGSMLNTSKNINIIGPLYIIRQCFFPTGENRTKVLSILVAQCSIQNKIRRSINSHQQIKNVSQSQQNIFFRRSLPRQRNKWCVD